MSKDELQQKLKRSIDTEITRRNQAAEQKKISEQVQYAAQITALQPVMDAFQLIRDEVSISHKIPCKCLMCEDERFVEIFLDARDIGDFHVPTRVLFLLVNCESDGSNPPMFFLGDGEPGGSRPVSSFEELLAEVTQEIGKFISTVPVQSLPLVSDKYTHEEVSDDEADEDEVAKKAQARSFLLWGVVVGTAVITILAISGG